MGICRATRFYREGGKRGREREKRKGGMEKKGEKGEEERGRD